MAFDFSFDFDNQLVYIKASISIDLVSSIGTMKALLSDDRFGKDMRILADIRDVEYAPSRQDIITLLHSPVWRAFIDGHRLAVVAGKALQFGMVNVLAQKTGDSIEMEPFYSLDDAKRWLKVNEHLEAGLTEES